MVISLSKGVFVMKYLNKIKIISMCLLILILFVIIISPLVRALDKEISGLIIDVDKEKRGIKLYNYQQEKWYYLNGETRLIRNGVDSTINACYPLEGVFYQWASLEFNEKSQLIKIIVEYNVKEGIIREIDLNKAIIKVNIFKDNCGINNNQDSYQFNSELAYLVLNLREGEHIVFISRGNMIYYICK
jgi:hypothetical protein